MPELPRQALEGGLLPPPFAMESNSEKQNLTSLSRKALTWE